MLTELPLMIVSAWLADRYGRARGLRAHDLTRSWLRRMGPTHDDCLIPTF